MDVSVASPRRRAGGKALKTQKWRIDMRVRDLKLTEEQIKEISELACSITGKKETEDLEVINSSLSDKLPNHKYLKTSIQIEGNTLYVITKVRGYGNSDYVFLNKEYAVFKESKDGEFKIEKFDGREEGKIYYYFGGLPSCQSYIK